MKKYKKIDETDIQFFRQIIGEEYVLLKHDDSFDFYTHDTTEDLKFEPEIVCKPKTKQQIAQIVKYCNKNLIPITPSGGRTGLMGGSLAIHGGLILSLERLNQIINIDSKNFQVRVESGVINQQLQKELSEFNLFYPPDPSSWGTCQIGGNIATNAGGPSAVKYGVTRDYVLSLELVLPNGEIIETAANTFKNSTAYSLTQLIIGSEGTLGVVTEATLKVLPKPKHDISLLIPFESNQQAAEAVATILHSGIQPTCLEFMERKAIETAINFLEESTLSLPNNIQAHLLILLDSNHEERLLPKAEKLVDILSDFDIGEILLAQTDLEKERLWKLRRRVAEIVKSKGFTIEEDTAVPIAEMPKLIAYAHKLAEEFGCEALCYGHAGDGNLHIRFRHPEFRHSYQNEEIQPMLTKLFKKVKSLGGTISAEHGIGLIQKSFLPIFFNQESLELQKSIKLSFDPNNIMNPDKILR